MDKINYNGEYKLVVLDRGFIKIGKLFSLEDNMFRLENSYTVRRWGTTKGIGEIALGGPTKDTILDRDNTCEFHLLRVIHFMDVNQEIWGGVFNQLLIKEVNDR